MDVYESVTLNKEALDDLIYKTWKETTTDQRAVLILSAADPNEFDTNGIYLEIVILDDNMAVVRDRWANFDANYAIVRTDDIYDIFRGLVDQVNELNASMEDL